MSIIKICDICNKSPAKRITFREKYQLEPADPEGGYVSYVDIDLCFDHAILLLENLSKDCTLQFAENCQKMKKEIKI